MIANNCLSKALPRLAPLWTTSLIARSRNVGPSALHLRETSHVRNQNITRHLPARQFHNSQPTREQSKPNAKTDPTQSLLPNKPELLRQGRSTGLLWSAAEDERLQQALAKYGADWVKIANHVGGGRTNRGCRQRWMLSLRDGINRKRFSRTEITQVLHLNTLYPKQWQKIADELGTGRTRVQVFEILQNRLNDSISTMGWSVEEDQQLRHAVGVCGVGKWAAVAGMMPGRSDAQCYERWSCTLAPELVRGEWKLSEDERLIEAVSELRKTKTAFHFGHVAELMDNTRHRKSCLARYKRLVQYGKAEALPRGVGSLRSSSTTRQDTAV